MSSVFKFEGCSFPLGHCLCPPTCVQHALDVPRVVVLVTEVLDFALEGLGKLLNTIKSVQKIHNIDLDIEGMDYFKKLPKNRAELKRA